MADNEQISHEAETKDNEPLFFLGVLGIWHYKCFIIKENRLGFFKSNAVLMLVHGILILIPLKVQHTHNYIIIIEYGLSREKHTQTKTF